MNCNNSIKADAYTIHLYSSTKFDLCKEEIFENSRGIVGAFVS